MFKLHENRRENCANLIGENEIEQYIDKNLQCLSHLAIPFAIGNRYCRCGKTRSIDTYEFEEFLSGRTDYNIAERDLRSRPLTCNVLLNVNKNAVFLTKKSLMLNQFLVEYRSSSNDAKKEKVDADKYSWLKGMNESSLQSRYISKPSRNSSRDDGDGNNSAGGQDNISSWEGGNAAAAAICSASSALLDKRFVSFLRGITLYWFICLNTVLAKNDELLKKKGSLLLNDDFGDGTTSTTSSAFALSCDFANLQASLNLIENVYDLESDCLWNLFRGAIVRENRTSRDCSGVVLSLDQHSGINLSESILRRLLKTLIGMWRQSSTILHLPAIIPRVQLELRRSKVDGLAQNGATSVSAYPTGTSYPRIDIIEKVDAAKAAKLFEFMLPSCNNDAEASCHANWSTNDSTSMSVDEDEASNEVSSADGSGGGGGGGGCSSSSSSGSSNTSSTTDGEECSGWTSSSDGESVSTGYPESDLNSECGCCSQSDELDSVTEDVDSDNNDDNDNDATDEVNENDITDAVDENIPYVNDSKYELIRFIQRVGIANNYDPYAQPEHETDGEFQQYHLWRSPLNPLNLLRSRQSAPKCTKYADESSSSSSSASGDYAQYQMWESPIVSIGNKCDTRVKRSATQDNACFLPSSVLQRNAAIALNEKLNPSYNIWGSPIIVDFQQISKTDTDLIIAAAAAAVTNPQAVDADSDSSDVQNSFYDNESSLSVDCGTCARFKPLMSAFVMLTDRGAFNYYRRPEWYDCVAERSPTASTLSSSCSSSSSSSLSSSITDENEVVDDAATAAGHETRVETDENQTQIEENVEVAENEEEIDDVDDDDDDNNVDEETRERNRTDRTEAIKSVYLFRPIQPAFKVATDAPPLMAQSPCGTYYQNGQKWLVFNHEAESQPSGSEPRPFRPKYAITTVDQACQTEPLAATRPVPQIVFQQLQTSVISDPSGGRRAPYRRRAEPPLPNGGSSPRPYLYFGPFSVAAWSASLSAAAAGPQQHRSASLVAAAAPKSWLGDWPAASSSPYWPDSHASTTPASSSSFSSYWSSAEQPFSGDPPLARPASSDPPPLYYGLEDMFNRLGQPGFTNVGHYVTDAFF